MTNQCRPEEEEERAHKHAKLSLRQYKSILILFPLPREFGRTSKLGDREVACHVECFLCQLEDLSSIPSTT